MLSALLLSALFVSDASACTPGDGQVSAYLEMPFEQFDQTNGEGWRALGETAGCHAEAGEMIVDYILHSRAGTDGINLRVLRFHAGQNFAFANQTERALAFFRATYSDPEAVARRRSYTTGSEAIRNMDWNSYVDATIAFLEGNRPALEAAAARLEQQTPFEDGRIPNLNVADGFLACFGQPYSEAYSSRCMSDGRRD